MSARRRLAARALARQLAYQQAKARTVPGREAEYVASMHRRSADVRRLIEAIRPLPPDARVIEVGSGAHGLIFHFGMTRGVGCDPWPPTTRTSFPRGSGACARPSLVAHGHLSPRQALPPSRRRSEGFRSL